MTQFVASEVTSGNVPSIHAGLNYKRVQYTLAETASASATIVMAVLPPGARVAGAHLTVDNNALDATGAGSVSVHTETGGNFNGAIIQTAAASTLEFTYNPTDGAHGLRHTSSSHAVVKLSNFAATGTGTASTVFTLSLLYTASEDGD